MSSVLPEQCEFLTVILYVSIKKVCEISKVIDNTGYPTVRSIWSIRFNLLRNWSKMTIHFVVISLFDLSSSSKLMTILLKKNFFPDVGHFHLGGYVKDKNDNNVSGKEKPCRSPITGFLTRNWWIWFWRVRINTWFRHLSIIFIRLFVK